MLLILPWPVHPFMGSLGQVAGNVQVDAPPVRRAQQRRDRSSLSLRSPLATSAQSGGDVGSLD